MPPRQRRADWCLSSGLRFWTGGFRVLAQRQLRGPHVTFRPGWRSAARTPVSIRDQAQVWHCGRWRGPAREALGSPSCPGSIRNSIALEVQTGPEAPVPFPGRRQDCQGNALQPPGRGQAETRGVISYKNSSKDKVPVASGDSVCGILPRASTQASGPLCFQLK